MKVILILKQQSLIIPYDLLLYIFDKFFAQILHRTKYITCYDKYIEIDFITICSQIEIFLNFFKVTNVVLNMFSHTIFISLINIVD